ncbi:MAG TPA: hypothetical protein VIU61_20385 [Kofleriaceae bacterium]
MKAELFGSETRVQATVGATSGVTMSWRAALQDPAHTVGKLVRVQNQLVTIAFALPTETVTANPTVRLCP